jgi:hypothetical protein
MHKDLWEKKVVYLAYLDAKNSWSIIRTEHASGERKRDAFWENIRLGFRNLIFSVYICIDRLRGIEFDPLWTSWSAEISGAWMFAGPGSA